MSGAARELPRWADVGLIPLAQSRSPPSSSPASSSWRSARSRSKASRILVSGAFGYGSGIGYTLFYTTNFIFTGLAFAVAFHAGLFNIGAEGQAYLGGLGVALVCLPLGFLPMADHHPARHHRRGAVRRGLGLHSRPISRPSAAATSSSRRSCSISSPRR